MTVLDLLISWTKRTDQVLHRELIKWGIGQSGELDDSIKSDVRQVSNEVIISELEFLMRGRFRDMGAGRGSRKIESREGNRSLAGGNVRKPKQWYSRAYWARINDLQGAIGFRLMESSIEAIKNPLDQLNTNS